MPEMNRTCRQFRTAFLLSDTDAPEEHSLACADCDAFVRAERATRALVRSQAPRWAASTSLRERLAGTLAVERRAGSSTAVRRRRLLVAAMIAGVVAASVGVWWWSAEVAGVRRANEVADLIVEDFLKYAPLGPEKLHVPGGDATAMEEFFAREFHFAATVPRIDGALLAGGRRCNLGGRPTALMFLDRVASDRAGPLALFVFEPRGEDWSAMDEVPGRPGRRACHESRRGVSVVLWQERGLTYALAGAADVDELVSLVAEHL